MMSGRSGLDVASRATSIPERAASKTPDRDETVSPLKALATFANPPAVQDDAAQDETAGADKGAAPAAGEEAGAKPDAKLGAKLGAKPDTKSDAVPERSHGGKSALVDDQATDKEAADQADDQKADHREAGDGKSGQDRSSQDRSGQDKSNHDSSIHGKSDGEKADEEVAARTDDKPAKSPSPPRPSLLDQYRTSPRKSFEPLSGGRGREGDRVNGEMSPSWPPSQTANPSSDNGAQAASFVSRRDASTPDPLAMANGSKDALRGNKRDNDPSDEKAGDESDRPSTAHQPEAEDPDVDASGADGKRGSSDAKQSDHAPAEAGAG